MKRRRRITFPPEIHGLIIDILAGEKNISTIKVLARTHSSMLHPCRSHIFAKLTLVPGRLHSIPASILVDSSFSTKLAYLARLFSSKPDLAVYVRTLFYWIPSYLAYDNANLRTVLDRLSRIQTLHLSSQLTGRLTDASDRIYWPALPPTIRVALEEIMHSPSLVNLVLLSTSKFPIKVLAGCKNLGHLDLNKVYFQDDASSDDEELGLPSSPLRLGSLANHFSIQGIQTLITSKFARAGIIELTHLSTLQSFDVQGATAIVLEVLTCLESVNHVVWDGHVDPYRDILSPNILRTLKVFKTKIHITWARFIADPLLNLTDEFDKWAGNNVLEIVDIMIDIDKDASVAFSSSNWAKLNDLGIAHRFPAMQNISLTIKLTTVSARRLQHLQPIEVLERNQNTVFGNLMESDKVTFEFTVEKSEW